MIQLLLMFLLTLAPQQSLFDLYFNEQIIRETNKAWNQCERGYSNRESVIIVRMIDGQFVGELLKQSREIQERSFYFNAAIKAVIHTHSNRMNPVPSSLDKALATKWRVPVFVISRYGLYVYEPKARRTVLVKSGLSWLQR